MAYDMFLQINGIPGDSTDSEHADWIEIESFKHALAQPKGGSWSAQGNLGAGRVDHGEFTVQKRFDSASPKLAQYCCTGQAIPQVEFELCRPEGEKTGYMKYTLKNAMISGVEAIGSGKEDQPTPLEEVRFRYGEIHWEYTPTDTSGGKGAPVRAGWSTTENRQTA